MFCAELWKNIRVFLSKNFQFLEVKFSIYLNRRVFVMPIMARYRFIKNGSWVCRHLGSYDGGVIPSPRWNDARPIIRWGLSSFREFWKFIWVLLMVPNWPKLATFSPELYVRCFQFSFFSEGFNNPLRVERSFYLLQFLVWSGQPLLLA